MEEQSPTFVPSPTQSAPPCCGGVHIRVEDCVPPPQVTEHVVDTPHSLHSPSTDIKAVKALRFYCN